MAITYLNKENPRQNAQPLVWVVDSAYTGERHARIGLAERLGYGYDIVPMPDGDADSYGQMLKHKYTGNGNGGGVPLLVISGTGEETTAEIADLRKLFDGCLFNIYLASILPEQHHPRLCEYDLIASPQLIGTNIITMVGVPHQLTRARLATVYQQHESIFNKLPRPIIGLLVGGNTRYCNGFNATHAKLLARRVAKISKSLGGSIVVSNSPRTPTAAFTALQNELAGLSCCFFDWRQIETSVYHALLAHADLFVVTGDSLSMCSEAAFTGKPLLVDLSDNATETYHREIVGRLVDYGAARPLCDNFEPWTYTPPDPTEGLANAIKRRLRETI
ncbi:MAG: ELM1/GtrOC1 family putative glycosyltransferase [Methylovulum sp.]|nr:ELM1/GtrOC1 family putative glycosyltransferase [Methylovulum sp.]